VRQESINIEAAAQRKSKQALVERKIAESNLINKARLRTLDARQQMIQQLFDVGRERLVDIPKDTESYKRYLHDSILQALFQLMDMQVEVMCRQEDAGLVQTVMDDVTLEYQIKTQQSVTMTMAHQWLDGGCAGGVIVTALGGRIQCDNTLQRRLDLLAEQMLPEIRVMLFGHSPNRKFFN
jgi:V-type H+-transporting ATPase subunit E